MNAGAGYDPNTELLDTMVGLLGDVADDLVFVGGCATGLLITATRVQSVRATTDVDVVAEATTIREYHILEARLRDKGFEPDPEVICRWNVAGLQLDLLPSGPNVLSFHNRWYPHAIATALPHRLPSGRTIRVLTSPLFLATKMEAFLDRGQGDWLASHDLEDIVTVVDGREELIDEVAAASPEIRDYLRSRLGDLLRQEAFLTALPGHLPGDVVSQARLPRLLATLRRLASDEAP
jgi:predicted nucleotidyltransferase